MNPPVRAEMVDYASLQALRGAELVRAAGRLMASGQVMRRYPEAGDVLFGSIDDVTAANSVLDAYTGAQQLGVSDRETAAAHKLNVEHTWPRSRGALDMAEVDLHHLRATDMGVNGKRANIPFGDVVAGSETYTSPAGRPWQSRIGHDAAQRVVFEPPSEVKGDIARGLLYFASRYATGVAGARKVDVADFLGSLPTLLRWSREDPVTDAERARNDRVAAFQGNRNAFVDHPELVEAAGERGFRDAVVAHA